jgi:hypothetical protein
MARGFGAALGAAGTDNVDSALVTQATSRTYSILVYRDDTTSDMRIAGKELSNGLSPDEVLFQVSSTYRFFRNWSTTDGQWSIAQPAQDTWSHFLVTYDSGSTTNDPVMYLDGVSQTVTQIANPAGTIVNSAARWMLGNHRPDTSLGIHWRGMLAEFAIWNRILSASEIAALGNGFSPLFFPASLVEYVPMLRDNVSRKLSAPTITGTAVQPHPRIIYPASRATMHVPAVTAAGGITPTLLLFGIGI